MWAFRWVAAVVLALGLAGCGSGGDKVMPNVVGHKLDVALSDIKRAGIDEEVEVLGGGVLGIVVKSNWQVCDQLPAAGEAVRGTPRLTVDRSCGDDVPGGTATPLATSTPTGTANPTETATTPTGAPSQHESTTALAAKQVERFLKESYGMKSSEEWTSLCRLDGELYPYPCAISKITLDSGILHIHLQDRVSETQADKYAMYALNFLCASEDTAAKYADIRWVEISDTSGGAVGQQSAAENRMCQMNQ